MSKTHETPPSADNHGVVAALERELKLTREQHDAELAALRADIKALRERDAGGHDRALERLIDRVEGTVPNAVFQQLREKATAKERVAADWMLEPYRTALGEPGDTIFFCGLIGWDSSDGAMRNKPPIPRNRQGRVVAAQNMYEAQARYEALTGIGNGAHCGKFSDGVTYLSYVATPEEAAKSREEILSMIDAGRDVADIITTSHKFFVIAHNSAVAALAPAVGVS